MAATTNGRRAEILILDDERPIVELLGELLDMRGYHATLCGSGTEAIALLDCHAFDLVISDLRMPEMSGQDFYGLAVRKNPELARRIVFITGDILSEDNQSFLDSTGNPHLSKPFKLAAIEKVISDTLQRSSLS